MEASEISALFNGFNDLTCLIIGDVMVDAYIWGNVDRISPEAPVPVFQVQKRENRLGGAANVALNIQALGAKPILCGVIGKDVKGGIFEDIMQEAGLSNEGIIQTEDRLTTCKTRIIASSHHMLRVDEEELANISTQASEMLVARIKKITAELKIDVVIFEDYDKGLLNPTLIQTLVDYFNDLKIPTCVDPKKDNFLAYKNTTLFKPNFKEFVVGLKQDVKKGDIPTLFRHAKQFRTDQGIDQLMITLSEHGVLMATQNEEVHIPAEIRNISDVSGAGDTVISTAALALASNLPKPLIVTLSNLAGGLVCEQVGVVPINKEKLQSEFIKRMSAQ